MTGVLALALAAASAAVSAVAQEVAVPPSIRPLLAAHCIDCHEGPRAKGALDLTRAVDPGLCEESVLRAVRRRLARRDMPPPTESVRPDDAEYRSAVAAIDSVCRPESREVPAVRRLNRAQYAGAVRDVLGTGSGIGDGRDQVAELLPRDEIGEGFDTTASTLALAPLLVEKYLDAAEALAAACVPPASWSQKRVFPAEQLERRGQGGTSDGVAWLATNGTLSARCEIAQAGRYRVTVEACGQFAGDQQPVLQLLADGVECRAVGITEPAGSLQPVAAELELARGPHGFAARFANDFWDPKHPDPARRDRNLGVARIVVEGPLGEVADTAFELRAAAIAGDGDARVRLARVAGAVGEELFRRALRVTERDALADTALTAAGPGARFDAQLRALVTALLVDPRFLLRIEAAPAQGRAALAPDEFASRLAFFLWSSVPDAELRRAAAAGELAGDDAIRAQVRRMLADPRARSLSARFATQWLGIDALEARQLDPVLFPAVTAALLESMRRETEMLFDDVVRGDKPVRALVEARTTRVDARLAAHYGLAAPPDGVGWIERTVPDGRGGGVLGHASVLVATSNPTRTSPVKRGKWVLQALLDDAPPPPPPGVPQLPERPDETKGLSVRELMALHRTNPDCASCHVRMDAIGLAFESFAADGRERDGVSDETELPDGSTLRGVAGVGELLAGRRAFERSFARQLLVYALGRGTADADDPLVDRLGDALARQGSFAALCGEIATSDAFRTRTAR